MLVGIAFTDFTVSAVNEYLTAALIDCSLPRDSEGVLLIIHNDCVSISVCATNRPLVVAAVYDVLVSHNYSFLPLIIRPLFWFRIFRPPPYINFMTRK